MRFALVRSKFKHDTYRLHKYNSTLDISCCLQVKQNIDDYGYYFLHKQESGSVDSYMS